MHSLNCRSADAQDAEPSPGDLDQTRVVAPRAAERPWRCSGEAVDVLLAPACPRAGLETLQLPWPRLVTGTLLARLHIAPPRVFQVVDPAFSERRPPPVTAATNQSGATMRRLFSGEREKSAHMHSSHGA